MSESSVADRIAETIKSGLSSRELRNPFASIAHHVSKAEAFRVPALEKAPNRRIRLALVCLPELEFDLSSHTTVPYEVLSQKGVDSVACERALVRLREEQSIQLSKCYEKGLEIALEGGGAGGLNADIVCFNELGFPTVAQTPREETVAFTRAMAKKHGAYIVGGSCHDVRTLYNTGRIFYPGCPPSGQLFHKQISAISIGEKVSIPSERKMLVTRVFGLWVGTLICLDVADFASVSAAVNFCDRVDLLLVPCYSPWMDKLEKIALAASKPLGMIAMPNYIRRGDKAEAVVTRFGETIDAVETRTIPGSGKASVRLYEIELEWFVPEKIRRRTSASSEERMEWLFGNRTQPYRQRA